MASYLYGLLLSRNAGRLPGDVRGLDRARLRSVPCDALTALVSDLGRAPDRRSLEDVRAHDSALRDAVRAGITVAASRFGQTFVDDAALCADVAARGAPTAALLDACDGCIEMRLLLTADDDGQPPGDSVAADTAGAVTAPAAAAAPAGMPATGPGTAYLQRMRQAVPVTPRLSLRAALGPMVRDERVEALPGGKGVVVAHLVARTDERAWRDAIGLLAARGTVVGPLPLYSFGDGREAP